ncbi:MAG: LPS export ABC transporter permease LptF [Rhodospirillaceae bacterium]|nr:LPS export ABC transporter permease LptF [Rhodospirillaceae bacterium]
MALISRYIVRQVVLLVLFVTAALALAIWLSQSLRFLDIILNRGLPAGLAMRFLALMLPSLLAIILPLSLFIAVLFVYHRLIADSELVIVRSSGVSNLGLARPALAVAGVVAILCLFLTAYGMPASYRAFHTLERTIRDRFAQILIEPGVFTDIGDGVTIFARERTRDGLLRGVVVHDVRDPANRITYTAEDGSFVSTPAGPRVVLEDGTYQKTGTDRGDISVLYFDRVVIGLNELAAAAAAPVRRDPRDLYLHELFNGPYRNQAEKLRERAEGHQRLVIPIYVVVFTLIALAALLHGSVHRFGRWLRMAVAVGGVIAVQSAGFALQSLAARVPSLAPLMYAVPLAGGLAALAVLAGPRPWRLGRTPSHRALEGLSPA